MILCVDVSFYLKILDMYHFYVFVTFLENLLIGSPIHYL